jgi:hypothetical protein
MKRLHRCPLNALRMMLTSVWIVVASLPVHADQAKGPFASLIGSWSGIGTIQLASGAKERIRCLASNRFGSNANSLRLDLSCESDSYKFHLRSQVLYRDGSITGTWDESTRATGGSIDGRVAGNQMRIRAEGQTFTAILALTTQGERQSIAIQSPGSEMSDVTIVLTRKARQ